MTDRKLTFLLLSFKSLLRKKSFWICLLLIPFFVVFMNITSKEESGILRVSVIYDDSDSAGKEIAQRLIGKDSLILFKRAETLEEEKQKIVDGELDAVWLFSGDTSKKIDEFFSTPGLPRPFVDVYERSGSIGILLSHELLFGAVYPNVSRTIYHNFVFDYIYNEAGLTMEEVDEAYAKHVDAGKLLDVRPIEGAPARPEETDYLTQPLRGLLSLTIVLAGLAGAVYHRIDLDRGKYAPVSVKKRLFPAYATVFPAVFVCGLAVFLTLVLTGKTVSAAREALSMLLFIISVTSTGVLASQLFPSAGALGAAIPVYMLTATLISPIFFNLPYLISLQRLLPTYYYIDSVYNSRLYYLFAGFAAILALLTFAADFLKSRRA